jgi:hypothetical protein
MTTNIISTQALKDALRLVLSGTGTAQALEGSDSLVVSGGAIHSYNGEISVSVPLVDIEGNPVTVTGCLKAKTLASYVAKLKGDTVEVEVSDTGAWTLRTAKGTVEPATFNDPLSARLAELNLAGLKWENLPGHFVSALALVRLDNGKLEQPYILFTTDVLLARDRFRYNAYDLREVVDGEVTAPDIGTFALNSDYVKELLNCSDLVQIAHSGSYAHFLTESGVVLSIKKTDGSAYPEAAHRTYLGMLDTFKLLCETDLPTDLAGAIDRTSVFAQDDKVSGMSKIEVSIRPDRMELRTSRTEGKATEALSWPMPLPESANIDMTMSGPFLKEAASRGIKLKVLLHELGTDAAGNDRGTRTVIVFQNANFTQMVSTLA